MFLQIGYLRVPMINQRNKFIQVYLGGPMGLLGLLACVVTFPVIRIK